MKDLTKPHPECDYSFEMLYRAAYGKNLDTQEKNKLQTFSQNDINTLVKKWAKKAQWITITRTGSDGADYLAFYPQI